MVGILRAYAELHDGVSYTAAIGAADGVARSEGIPVHDLAGGAA